MVFKFLIITNAISTIDLSGVQVGTFITNSLSVITYIFFILINKGNVGNMSVFPKDFFF